jgi:hypothetical protein
VSASPRAWQLANAIEQMADRRARSERRAAHAFSRQLHHHIEGRDDRAAAAQAEQDRYDRASERQYLALQRLVEALRDLSGGAV